MSPRLSVKSKWHHGTDCDSMERVVFLDRDGVINEMKLGKYVTAWKDFHFIDGALDALRELASTEFRIIIITNQSPVNRGLITEEELKEIHGRMVQAIRDSGGRVDAIYHCPHRPDEGCGCRKPETGLFEQASRDYEIDFPGSWFVGDFESDRQVAERVGVNFILAEGPGGLKRAVDRILEAGRQ